MGKGRLYNQIAIPNRKQNNQVLSRAQNIQQSSFSDDILKDVASKGFKLNINDFIKFANMMRGKDVAGIINELRESGQMTDEMYQSLEAKANGLIGLAKLFR